MSSKPFELPSTSKSFLSSRHRPLHAPRVATMSVGRRMVSKPVLIVLPVFVFLLVAWHLSSSNVVAGLGGFSPFPSPHCSPDFENLQKLRLTAPEAKYAFLEIQVEYSSKTTTTSEQLEVDLPSFNTYRIDDSHEAQGTRACGSPIKMHFRPPARQADLSHIMFGLATTLERLEPSMNDFAHWITGTGAQMLVHVDPTPQSDMERVRERAERMGFHLIFVESDMEHMDRYFRLAKLTYDYRQANTRWSILMDDDTFFKSSSSLASFLSKFDASKPWFIGGLSEDFGQIKQGGMFAFGGASIILSMPILHEIYPFHDACMALESSGDTTLTTCIHQNTATKLHVEESLRQIDMHADLSGYFEAGSARSQFLSLHHWKSWYEMNVTKMAYVSSICGDDCLLQRFKFRDGWWLTNGFSLVKYSKDIKPGEITMEHTWWDPGDYRFSIDPLRPKDESKVSLRLETVEVEENRVRQFYVRRTESVDEVFEVIWTKR